jgi:hypothetical protein
VKATASLLALASVVSTAFVACGNPAYDVRIDELGGENPNVEASEFHRPGQPCVLCHGEYEGALPQISIGGTVFADQQSFLPVAGVQVVMTDTRGITYTAVTNCIGNFWVEAGAWDQVNNKYPDPQFPVAVDIRCPTYDEAGQPVVDATGAPVLRVKSMGSVISRDGSCATCHTLQGKGLESAGWIYCNAPGEVNPFPPLSPDCPGEPP